MFLLKGYPEEGKFTLSRNGFELCLQDWWLVETEKLRGISFLFLIRREETLLGRRNKFHNMNKSGYILDLLGLLCPGWTLKGMVALVHDEELGWRPGSSVTCRCLRWWICFASPRTTTVGKWGTFWVLWQRTARGQRHGSLMQTVLGWAVVLALSSCASGQITFFLCTSVYALKIGDLDRVISEAMPMSETPLVWSVPGSCSYFYAARPLGKDPCPELSGLMWLQIVPWNSVSRTGGSESGMVKAQTGMGWVHCIHLLWRKQRRWATPHVPTDNVPKPSGGVFLCSGPFQIGIFSASLILQ